MCTVVPSQAMVVKPGHCPISQTGKVCIVAPDSCWTMVPAKGQSQAGCQVTGPSEPPGCIHKASKVWG